MSSIESKTRLPAQARIGAMKRPAALHLIFKLIDFRLSAACGLALVASACVVEDTGGYIGKDPFIVFQHKFMVDQMTMPFPSGRPSVDWGMTLVWLGDHYLLTVDENTTPGQASQIWRMVAAQDFPLLKKGQMIAFGTCRDDGAPAPRVVAVVQYAPDKQWLDGIVSAWTYDFHKVAIVDYPTTKLACLNPRFGLGLDKPAAPATSAVPGAATVLAPAATTKQP
jgi:hypothetical protein